MPRENIWQTKLMIKDFGPERYLMDASDINHPEMDRYMQRLAVEMKEVFHLN